MELLKSLNLRVFLGIALLVDVAFIGAATLTGADTTTLESLALALSGGVAGAALPR